MITLIYTRLWDVFTDYRLRKDSLMAAKKTRKKAATTVSKSTTKKKRTTAAKPAQINAEPKIQLSHDAIAREAYLIWLQKGGSAQDNWLEAEQRLASTVEASVLTP